MTNLKTTSFGEFIKNQREQKGWTQTEFGAKIGINSSAVSRIENGTKQLSSKKLQTLAMIFEIDISKISELYFAHKFAKEMIEYNCPESTLTVAEQAVKYIKAKSSKQLKLDTL
jgi:transcriptional regulator with XRE-family HTH domain